MRAGRARIRACTPLLRSPRWSMTTTTTAAGVMTTDGPVSTPSVPPVHDAVQTYMRSSQARNWRFSARQVEKMRSDGNEAARRRLAALWETERSLPSVDGEPEPSSSAAPIDFLTVDEEQALIAYYLTRVRQLVKAFSLPELVEATTITFIKRFYLRNTCMDFHPKSIMLTCLFLAAKAENNAIPLRHFSTKLAGKDPTPAAVAEYTKTVQDLEFLVSQSLSFEYAVHGAHRALHGLWLDMQTLPSKPSTDKLHALLGTARAKVQQSRMTDVELTYVPSQISLACVRAASDDGREVARRYLEAKARRAGDAQRAQRQQRQTWRATERQRLERRGVAPDAMPDGLRPDVDAEDIDGETPASDVERTLDEIDAIVQAGTVRAAVSVDEVKLIDKKLKMCQNPERMTTSRVAHHAATTGKQASVLGKRDTARADEDEDDDDVVAINAAASAKRIKADA